MALNVRHPIWVHALDRPGARAFALLFALDAFTRAILSTILPLQVLDAVGDPASLSAVFLIVSLLGLCANFSILPLTRLITRRWTYTLGCAAFVAAAFLIGHGGLIAVSLGMFCRLFAAASITICTNLYVLDHIKGKALNEVEPLRLFFSAAAWTIGPFLGVFLWSRIHWLPFALSLSGALLLLVTFWIMRIGDNPIITPAKTQPRNPLASLIPFFKRPALRRSWLIAFGRSCWWVSFFVYLPVFGVQSGMTAEKAALLVSAGNALLFIVPLITKVTRGLGVRGAIILASIVAGLITAAAGLLAWISPLATVGAMLVCALFTVMLDIYGNVPFLRMVRPSERLRMTPVFVTYRDLSDIATPAVAGAVLLFFPLPAFFLVLGGGLACIALAAARLPRRL